MDFLMVQRYMPVKSYCWNQTCWGTSNPKAKIRNIQLKWTRWIMKEGAEQPQLRDHSWHVCLWTLDFLNLTKTRLIHSFKWWFWWLFLIIIMDFPTWIMESITKIKKEDNYHSNFLWSELRMNFPIFRFGPLGIFTILNNFDQNICASMPIFN